MDFDKVYEIIRSKKNLFSNASKIKINVTIIETDKNKYLKIYAYKFKKVISVYDLNNMKRLKTSDFGISSDKEYTQNNRERIIRYSSFDKFLYSGV